MNKYQYCLNNPVRYIDPTGKWTTSVHSEIIRNAFPGLSAAQQRILREASLDVDKDQSEEGSYKHAMRGPKQTVDEAKEQTANFMDQKENAARGLQIDFETQGGKGISPDALYTAGEAIHTATDRTSPAHTDAKGNPMVWKVRGDGLTFIIRSTIHVSKELKISPEQLKAAVSAAREQFRRTFGDAALKLAIAEKKVHTSAPRKAPRHD